jgi:hypothetical protein
MLEVDRKLKANALLPKLIYPPYLSEPQYIDSYKFENYKVGINFSYLYFYEKKGVA